MTQAFTKLSQSQPDSHEFHQAPLDFGWWSWLAKLLMSHGLFRIV